MQIDLIVEEGAHQRRIDRLILPLMASFERVEMCIEVCVCVCVCVRACARACVCVAFVGCLLLIETLSCSLAHHFFFGFRLLAAAWPVLCKDAAERCGGVSRGIQGCHLSHHPALRRKVGVARQTGEAGEGWGQERVGQEGRSFGAKARKKF